MGDDEKDDRGDMGDSPREPKPRQMGMEQVPMAGRGRRYVPFDIICPGTPRTFFPSREEGT